MGREIPIEIREQAEDLYVIDGLTYEQVSRRTGVSPSQLKRWAKEGDWRKARQEYRNAIRSIRRDTVLLRKKLVKKALETIDPQVVYAFSNLEKAVAKGTAAEETLEPATREIKSPEEAIDALQEAIEVKLNTMLSRPGAINLSGIKDMKKALELLEQMRNKYAKPEDRRRGLSEETVEDIKRRILGIS